MRNVRVYVGDVYDVRDVRDVSDVGDIHFAYVFGAAVIPGEVGFARPRGNHATKPTPPVAILSEKCELQRHATRAGA